MTCHETASRSDRKPLSSGQHLTVALAGNANVGKSVLFNRLTGSNQIIGNWPGKTVERAEGRLHFQGYDVTVFDLPGIYSFSTYSLEEPISREFIATRKPDAVINVVDASVLERNLFFTLQLREMGAPLVLCLNQVDTAGKKGITVDTTRLESVLGIPVVATVAIKGHGLTGLMERTVEVASRGDHGEPVPLRYDDRLETRIDKLTRTIDAEQLRLDYPSRWLAIKLLEDDPDITRLVRDRSAGVIATARELSREIGEVYKDPAYAVIASERHAQAHRIAAEVQRQSTMRKTFADRLDWLTTDRVIGYFTSAGVIAGLLLWTFIVGNLLSTLLSSALSFFEPLDPKVSGPVPSVLWNGVFGGFVAGVTLVIPFVIPFYFVLAMIEDSGILTRVAFMLDSAMHRMGLHGKAIIPLIFGYGCNVPAIYACRIMETRREHLLAAFAVTFAPCAARTIVLLGLVALFVGTQWALLLYVVDLVILFVVARVALKLIPEKLTGLIMEMHSLKMPSFAVVTKQTWTRTKSIIFMVFPIYMIGTAAVQVAYAVGVLEPVNNAMSFLTVGWLGLPAVAGILLLFGVVRKELILLTLVAIYGTDLGSFLTPVQFVVLALVGMLYLPCLSTIAILAREFGVKTAAAISLANLGSALLAGGVAFRLVSAMQ